MNNVESIIEDAIENMIIITFSYNGYARRVEPHHYGISGGVMQLHGYQVSNGSKSGQLHGWKNFMLDNICILSIDDNSTFSERSDYNPSNSNYSNIISSVRNATSPRPR